MLFCYVLPLLTLYNYSAICYPQDTNTMVSFMHQGGGNPTLYVFTCPLLGLPSLGNMSNCQSFQSGIYLCSQIDVYFRKWRERYGNSTLGMPPDTSVSAPSVLPRGPFWYPYGHRKMFQYFWHPCYEYIKTSTWVK